MNKNRDDFTPAIKELLANRVGRKCSNPSCRKLTCGPKVENDKIINVGVASHICAAAKGGPRYDEKMSSEERKSFENGIWLCQTCAKLIDSDTVRFTKENLLSWKKQAEELAILEVEMASPVQSFEQDKDFIKFLVQCFDRPAFRDDVSVEGSMEDFDRAIEDTLIALNTGVLRTRDGSILKQSEGKAMVQNPLWYEKLNTIADMLTSIRRRLKIAEVDDSYTKCINGENSFYW